MVEEFYKESYRFHEQEFPEEGEYVIVQIKEINDYSIVVALLEYNNLEGMITLAEYS